MPALSKIRQALLLARKRALKLARLWRKGQVPLSPASSSSQVAEGTISGTYKGTDETDQVTLVIQGDKGTWTAVEADGETESKPVQIDEVNQSMVIGDDTYRYRVDGQQLTLEDLDQEIDDHGTIVLTKQ